MPRTISPADRRLRANRQNPNVRSAILIQAARASQTTNTEVVKDPESVVAPMNVTHTRYGRFPVYKLTDKGCVRIEINAQSLGEVLSQPNYSDVCFDCQRGDCLYETQVPGEISNNTCEGKPARMSRICREPSCRKRIYDPVPTGKYLDEVFSEARATGTDGILDDDELDQSTPQSRTLARLKLHIIAFHTDMAAELNLSSVELPRLAVV